MMLETALHAVRHRRTMARRDAADRRRRGGPRDWTRQLAVPGHAPIGIEFGKPWISKRVREANAVAGEDRPGFVSPRPSVKPGMVSRIRKFFGRDA